ncbi:MAG: class I SAM-dependent methyltransferase [Haloferacaceae archaeon]
MPRTEPFEVHADRYEEWFEVHEHEYAAEVEALSRLVSDPDRGLEIGVGSGRFAEPLGFQYGVDPTAQMLARARDRGVEVVRGVAEALPFRDGVFDAALIVTTICFVDDVAQTLAEARRVLDADGALVLGYIDRASPVGELYRETKDENPFYRHATFVSTGELVAALETAGFGDVEFVQTIYHPPGAVGPDEPVEEGHGDGSFVGVSARPASPPHG